LANTISPGSASIGAGAFDVRGLRLAEHDPEKWAPAFREDHAPSTIWSAIAIQPHPIAL
jgi:hypothetical protein